MSRLRLIASLAPRGLGVWSCICIRTPHEGEPMRTLQITIGLLFAMIAGACSTAPKSAGDREDLVRDAESALVSLQNKDPALRGLLSSAAGYAIFPEIGKGGFVVGGAYGRGIL